MQLVWSAVIPRKAISLNSAFVSNFKTGRRFLSKEAKDLKDFVSDWARLTYRGQPNGQYLIEYMTFTFTNKARRDVDNLPKLINDSLSRIVFKDDSQVQELHLKKQVGECEQIEIRVYSCE